MRTWVLKCIQFMWVKKRSCLNSRWSRGSSHHQPLICCFTFSLLDLMFMHTYRTSTSGALAWCTILLNITLEMGRMTTIEKPNSRAGWDLGERAVTYTTQETSRGIPFRSTLLQNTHGVVCIILYQGLGSILIKHIQTSLCKLQWSRNFSWYIEYCVKSKHYQVMQGKNFSSHENIIPKIKSSYSQIKTDKTKKPP